MTAKNLKKSNSRKPQPCHNPSSNTQSIVFAPEVLQLKNISPITAAQKRVFSAYNEGKNLWLTGSAGTGKTFLALYLALRELDRDDTTFDKIYLVRSIVPVRDIGHLPGDADEKCSVYEAPYQAICQELYPSRRNAYNNLKSDKTIEFVPTSFIRGRTLENCIMIVDEASNLSFHELESTITRLGKNVRAIYCGDTRQTDFTKDLEKRGYLEFEEIISRMKSFDEIEFFPEDIVRGGLVREYLLAVR